MARLLLIAGFWAVHLVSGDDVSRGTGVGHHLRRAQFLDADDRPLLGSAPSGVPLRFIDDWCVIDLQHYPQRLHDVGMLRCIE